jgi:hypothetical protein
MPTWTPEEATQQLLAILPFLNRMVAAELRAVAGSYHRDPFRVPSHLAEATMTRHALAKTARQPPISGELVQTGSAAGSTHPGLVTAANRCSNHEDGEPIRTRRAHGLSGSFSGNSPDEMAAVRALPLRRILVVMKIARFMTTKPSHRGSPERYGEPARQPSFFPDQRLPRPA